MKKKLILMILVIILLIESIIPIKIQAVTDEYTIVSVPAKIERQQVGDEEDNSFLDSAAGKILEPLVELCVFIIDAVMLVTTSFMTQNSIEAVMVKNVDEIPNLGNATATFTITNTKPYKNIFGDYRVKYPNFTFSAEEIFTGKIDLLDVNFIKKSNDDTNWNRIRNAVADWYKALRMITIVGLLSVLIYIGIKIILSADDANSKSKYKQLLLNWIVAVILTFSMHYIMSFILSIIEAITALLDGLTGLIEVQLGEDITFTTNLIGLARFQIQKTSFVAKVGYLTIYVALVVYTFKFTFMYLKRVLKMAFLTVISPIVALTYPIDKANDGKAQGFEMWLKEYIYNALLQPMHYLLYYILVTSSLTLAAKNAIYGIVALMFMSQAEKLLKKIFGFEKANGGTVGGLSGAFATGAVTGALNNLVKDPAHPLKALTGSKSTKGKSSSGGNFSSFFGESGNGLDEKFDFSGMENDTDISNYAGFDTRAYSGSQNVQVGNPTNYGHQTPIVDDSINRYRQEIPQEELGELSFSDGLGSMKSLIDRIEGCEKKLNNPNLSDNDIKIQTEKLARYNTALKNRLEYNEAAFNNNGIPLQYADGDTRTNQQLMDEIMKLRKLCANATNDNEKIRYGSEANKLLKRLKKRMSENDYIKDNGKIQSFINNQNVRSVRQMAESRNRWLEQQKEGEKQSARVIRGVKNVGRTMVKPIWDTEKSTGENAWRLVRKGVGVAVGATVGITAAAVQAGISITDGKYNPMEGMATFTAGVVGGATMFDKAVSGFQKGYSEADKNSLERYSKQWFNNDEVIAKYKNEYHEHGKEMRERAVKNYVSRGITDFDQQKQAFKFAEQLKKERGMSEDEADWVAIGTLKYRQDLVNHDNYNVLFNEKDKKEYLDTQVDSYSGSASKNAIRKTHEDFLQNVMDFDRANR